MKYITGFEAFDLKCSTGVIIESGCGSDWSRPLYGESDISIFGDWGIEKNTLNKNLGNKYHANHIRALLDFMCSEDNVGYLAYAFNIEREMFSYEDKQDFFVRVDMLRGVPWWETIENFMQTTFMSDWFTFKVMYPVLKERSNT